MNKNHYIDKEEFQRLIKRYDELADNSERWFDKRIDDIHNENTEMPPEHKIEFWNRKKDNWEVKEQRALEESPEDKIKREKELYKVKNAIGRNFLKIIEGLLKLPSFINYDHFRKNSMTSDACLFMWTYLERFDHERYDNPFAYFTQTAKSAFIQHINKINKQKECVQNIDFIENMSEEDE